MRSEKEIREKLEQISNSFRGKAPQIEDGNFTIGAMSLAHADYWLNWVLGNEGAGDNGDGGINIALPDLDR